MRGRMGSELASLVFPLVACARFFFVCYAHRFSLTDDDETTRELRCHVAGVGFSFVVAGGGRYLSSSRDR